MVDTLFTGLEVYSLSLMIFIFTSFLAKKFCKQIKMAKIEFEIVFIVAATIEKEFPYLWVQFYLSILKAILKSGQIRDNYKRIKLLQEFIL